jgi:uncharacterized protein with PQ loop repeat
MTRLIIGSLTVVSQFLAFAAFFPQIVQLVKRKNSQGMSPLSWFLWLLSSSLLLAYSIVIRDPILIISSAPFIATNALVFYLVLRYRRVHPV